MHRIAILLLAVAAAVPIGAQTSPLEPPELGRFLRWGPVRVRPSLVVPNFGYDDNVFYRTGDQPTEGDWFVTLSPRVNGLALFGNRAFLTFDGRYDYTAYATKTSLNYSNYYIGSRLTVPFESFGFYLDLGHDRTQDRPIDLEDARPIRTNERLGYGAIVKLGWRTDAELGVTRSTWRNVDANYRTGSGLTIGDLLDRDEDGTRMKLRYRMFGRTRLTLETLRKTYDFANDTPGVAPDGKESRIVPGIDFGEGGRLSGAIRYGHANLDNEGTQTTDYSGRVGSAKLAWKPGTQTTVLLETKRDAYYSIYEASRIYVQTSYDLRVIRYFNRALGAEVGWRPGKLTFPGDPRNREDRLNDADVGVRLRLSENALGRRIEYTLRLTRYDRNSTVDTYDTARTVLGFGAVLGY
jgi:hypothetical protein